MSALWDNTSVNHAHTGLPNLTVAHELPCTFCCCGLLNRTLTVTFMVCLACAIIVGNVITLTVFLQSRLFRTPQGCLKVSLAVADVMVGALVVPFSVFTEISLLVSSAPPAWYQDGPGVTWHWQPCMPVGLVFAGCTFVSISTIFLLSVERGVAVLRPLQRDVLVTRRRTLILILLTWAGSFLLALAPLGNGLTLAYNRCSRMCNYTPLMEGADPNRTNGQDGSLLLLFPIFDLTLLGGTLAVNILSYTSIRRYTRKRKLLSEGSVGVAGATGGSPHTRPTFSDIKAAKTIGILTLAFAASFSPIAVFVLGSAAGHTWCSFSFVAFWMLAANSCCNVVIYSVRDRRFRKGVSVLFGGRRTATQGEHG